MKKLLALICLLPFFAFAIQKTTITLVKNKPTFTIAIPGNLTTGYSWFLSHYNDKLIKPLSYKYKPNMNKKLIGGPGLCVFTFTAKAKAFVVPHSTNITFVYTRPWMKQAIEKKTYSIRIMQ